MPRLSRFLPLIAVSALGLAATNAPSALASSTQEAIFQDGLNVRTDPAGTLNTLRSLGATRLRLLIAWSSVAPSPTSHRKPKFNASSPASYPSANWAIYDTIIRTAQADGIGIDLDLTGSAPQWAIGPNEPKVHPFGIWRPSAREYNLFVKAVGTRYSGKFRGLPRVNFWTVWNEPNYGQALAPQTTSDNKTELSGATYRGLVDAAWSGLHSTGHGHDTIVIGELAPRGLDHPIGNFSGLKPLRFLRALYCVDSRYRQLRGSAAAARGCPTNGAGSAKFRSQHPALFSASGFSDHPYPGIYSLPPNTATGDQTNGRGAPDPDYADLPKIPTLERVLDRLNSVYGSRTKFPIWSTEYGYQTRPSSKDPRAATPANGAYYMNWAEYLSWKQPRVRSYAQYLLVDPLAGNFASGLLFSNNRRKPSFDAYRLPIYLPKTTGRRGGALEVWGDARAVPFATAPQTVQVRFQAGSHGPFTTVRSVPITNSRGYFDVHVPFSGSGSVRLAWVDPLAGGGTAVSRTVTISLH